MTTGKRGLSYACHQQHAREGWVPRLPPSLLSRKYPQFFSSCLLWPGPFLMPLRKKQCAALLELEDFLGLSWTFVVVCFLLLCFLGPLTAYSTSCWGEYSWVPDCPASGECRSLLNPEPGIGLTLLSFCISWCPTGDQNPSWFSQEDPLL